MYGRKRPVRTGRIRSIRNWQSRTRKRSPVHVEPYVPEMDIGKRLLLGDLIGKGGVAVIEEAFDANLLAHRARKTILPELAGDEEACGYLVEEAQIAAQLDHPNIVPIYELGVDDHRRLFFTMKLIHGKTFSEIIHSTSYRTRTEKELFEQIQILLKVCDAVSFAHDNGVIHRDLKPDNIMVGDYGEVYLVDWGLALLTKKWRPSMMSANEAHEDGRRRYKLRNEQGINASPLYMAPEQTYGDLENIDEQTDVFGLGAILYEILTQLPPHADETIDEIFRKAITGTIIHPQSIVEIDLPLRLCEIAVRALRRLPNDRHKTALEFKQDIESFLQSGWQFKRRFFEKGSLIIREGDPGDEAYIITIGHCRVFKTVNERQIVLDSISVGDVFGEIALFTNRPRSASVEALDNVTAMVIERRHMEEDLGMSFWLGLFAKALGERLIEADERIIELEASKG